MSQSNRGASNWDPELGALFVVPSDTDNVAVVLFPGDDDAGVPPTARVTLLGSAGDTAQVTMSRTDSLQCGAAPMMRLTGNAATQWSVGMSGRVAPSIRMDSIESMPAVDSARLAVDLARLASALPMARDSRFGGLPFAVVSARFFDASGKQFIVAHLARRLNQEAAPLEERTLIVAERASGGTDRPVATYSQRSEGTEDTAEHYDILAALQGHGGPILVIERDQLSQTRYDILERASVDTWRIRWSRTLSC